MITVCKTCSVVLDNYCNVLMLLIFDVTWVGVWGAGHKNIGSDSFRSSPGYNKRTKGSFRMLKLSKYFGHKVVFIKFPVRTELPNNAKKNLFAYKCSDQMPTRATDIQINNVVIVEEWF